MPEPPEVWTEATATAGVLAAWDVVYAGLPLDAWALVQEETDITGLDVAQFLTYAVFAVLAIWLVFFYEPMTDQYD